MKPKGNRIVIYGNVSYILMKNGVATIDTEDVVRVRGYTWNNYITGVCSAINKNGKKGRIYLSRLILFGNKYNEIKFLTDHINHILLDNRKCNLRPASYSQNGRNRVSNKNSSSIFKGVHWSKKDNKWKASIKLFGKQTHLGYFSLEEEAAKAYDQAAIGLYGEFAKTNF
jgi:hypothetical protein